MEAATVWSVTAPWWQWVVAVVVSLVVWEKWVEHVWYKFYHWVQDKPHTKKVNK